MESDIFKFILSSQGSVDTEELVCNLSCDSSSLAELVGKSERLETCSWAGRPRVVVRSRVTVCRLKDCPGCRRLHLCLGFLYSGSCPYSRKCSFSHELHSGDNMEILREFGLETLSRTELCLLLLQSDNALLPPICYSYNTRGGCQDQSQGECPRLHVCQRYLSPPCAPSCPKTHDFSAPQPLKLLQNKHIPDHLIKLLKSIYANKQALRLVDKGKAASETKNHGNQDAQNTGNDSDSSTSSKQSHRRRSRRGRGGRGPNPDQTQDNHDQPDGKTSEESLQDDCDSDSSSVNSKNTRGRGRGGFRGKGRGRGNNTDRSKAPEGNRRGKYRGGRGSQGNRGGFSHVEGTFSKDDSENLEADISQSPSESAEAVREAEAGSACGNDQSSNKKSGSGWDTKEKMSKSDRVPPAGNASAMEGNTDRPQRRQRDKTEICMFFIKGHCKYEDHCFKAHDKMPYRWEIKLGGQWTPMTDNEKIEKDFCDPDNTYSTCSPPVHFDTMTCKTDEVRRLSTLNSVLEPDFLHTTDWLWYWEDEFGKWYQYAAITSEHRVSSITSKELEEWFVINNKDVVTFTAGSQSYQLSFQDMIQTNLEYGTKRLVRRRPRFVSAADVQTKRKRPTHSNAVPDYWNKNEISRIGYKRVPLLPSSGEFRDIQDLFHRTMAAYEIINIERIQNKTVWEAFQLQKTHMRLKNGGQCVLEKKLFHGTEPKHVDTICEANFDWRLCGVNGTVYGQGSYFARDAKYSHDYTGDSDPRFMFVSRVLVGDFARGSSEYRRPPSKDGGDVNLFDSCVDDIIDPSIFVVFKEQQIYPEYLLQYRQTGRSNVYGHYSSATPRQSYPVFRSSTQATVPPTRPSVTPVAPKQTPTPTTADDQSSCVIS